MAALDTVAKYIERARVLLQDTNSGSYRYSDAELREALNLAILEARSIRPDIFLALEFVLPNYTSSGDSTAALPEQVRVPFLYYIVGHAQLRDEEENQDQRAASLLNKFAQQLRAGV